MALGVHYIALFQFPTSIVVVLVVVELNTGFANKMPTVGNSKLILNP